MKTYILNKPKKRFFLTFLSIQESSALKTASLIRKCVLRQNAKYHKTKKLFNLTKTVIYNQTAHKTKKVKIL